MPECTKVEQSTKLAKQKSEHEACGSIMLYLRMNEIEKGGVPIVGITTKSRTDWRGFLGFGWKARVFYP